MSARNSQGGDSEDTQMLIRLQYDRLNSLKKYLTNYKKDPDDRKSKSYYQKRLERIEEMNCGFGADHHRIVCSEVDPGDDYFKNDIADLFENAFLEVYCVLQEDCDVRYPPQKPVMANPPEPSVADGAHVSVSRNMKVQIPNLAVPKFSGRIIDWPGFYDNFNRMFHLNTELGDTQRFHFLKEALPDDRDMDIHQMIMSEANYKVAWELLDKRYNNPRVLFIHHMNTLGNLPVLTKESSEDLKQMLNVAFVCIHAMEKMNIPIDQCDHWMAHQLAIRLPKDTHQAWEHHLGNRKEVPTFKDLDEFLNNRLITLDVIENRDTTLQTKTDSKSKNQSKAFKRANASGKTNAPTVNSTQTFGEKQKFNDKPASTDCPLCDDVNYFCRKPLMNGRK